MCVAGCDCSRGECTSTLQTRTSRSLYRFLKGHIMILIDISIERDDLVTMFDITEHILPFNSAEKGLINYSNYKKLKFSCTLSTCIQFFPQGSQSGQTSNYITL